MGQWLIADLSVSDVHLQLWMLLVTAILLVWFAFVWATPRSLKQAYSDCNVFSGLSDTSGALP